MRRYPETFLSSILLGTSVLLGLSFWLSSQFRFNLFSAYHWNELAKLQTSHAHVPVGFYIALGTALFVFMFGLYMIFKPKLRKTSENKSNLTPPNVAPVVKEPPISQPQPYNPLSQQPPKLQLPSNIKELVEKKHAEFLSNQPKPKPIHVTEYDAKLAEIFTNNSYVVKPNITISDFTSNLFAIGTDEVAWFGAVDCDINTFTNAINKLKSVFEETIDGVPINVLPFILDTKKLYDTDENILVFHDIEDLNNAISQNPNPSVYGENKEVFDLYSNYIDGIITYIKNKGL